MEEKILVNLCTDHTLECDTNILGREGEGHTARFWISVPEKLRTCSIYLDFKKPNGEKLRTPKLEVENGVAHYDVVPYLLTDEGEVQVQLVVKTASGGTWKTHIKKYYNYDSINAEDYINESLEKTDFIHEAQKVLDELSGEINEIASILSNNTSFVDNIINRVEEINIEEVETLKESVGTIRYDVGELSRSVGDLQVDLDEHKLTVDEHKTNIKENAQGILENQYDIEKNAQLINDLSNPIFRPVGSVNITNGEWCSISNALYQKINNKLCLVILVTEAHTMSGTIAMNGTKPNGNIGGYLLCGGTSFCIRIDEAGNYYANGTGTLYFYILGTLGEARTQDAFTLVNLNNQEIAFTWESGMTWREWANSDYNNGLVYIKDNLVYFRNDITDNRDGSVAVMGYDKMGENLVQQNGNDEMHQFQYIAQTTLISFTITHGSFTKTYTALDGMDWGEWVGSEYNDGKLYLSYDSAENDAVLYYGENKDGSKIVVNSTGKTQLINSTISNANYTVVDK